MNISRLTSSLYCVGAALMLLAGCSGSQSSLAPSMSAQISHRAVSRVLPFVAQVVPLQVN
jgi:uncharacterized lipoprotein YajG